MGVARWEEDAQVCSSPGALWARRVLLCCAAELLIINSGFDLAFWRTDFMMRFYLFHFHGRALCGSYGGVFGLRFLVVFIGECSLCARNAHVAMLVVFPMSSATS